MIRGLWRNPPFVRLWAAHAISQLGTQVTLLALPLTALLTLGAGPAEMGLLAAVEGLPWLLVGLPMGAWIDQRSRKPVLVAADIGRAVLLLVVPALALTATLRMEHLYVVGFALGVLSVAFDSAAPAYLPTLVRREQLVEANSKLEASRSVAELAGPPLGGLLVGVLSAPLALVADAASFLLSGGFLATINAPERQPAAASRQHLGRDILEGLRYVMRDPVLRATSAAAGTFNFFDGMLFSALYLLFVTQTLGFTPEVVGLLFAVGAIGGLLGAIFADGIVRWLGLGAALTISGVLAGVGSLLIPLAGLVVPLAFAVLALAEALVRGSSAVFAINTASLRQSITPNHLLGRVSATARMIGWGATPVGALLGGVLGEQLGVLPTITLGALGTLLASLWIVLSPARTLRA